MMTREERAKQFMPFDAMKGLQAALRDREERHLRVERHEISEEQQEKNSAAFARMQKGMRVELDFYYRFHDITRSGTLTDVDPVYRRLRLDNETVFFEDIYAVRFPENPEGSRYGVY